MSDAIPSACQLLAALRQFLDTDIAPRVDARNAYLLKVASHLLETVSREVQLGSAAHQLEIARLDALLASTHSLANAGTTPSEDLDAMNRTLCERIASGEQDLNSPELWRHLLQTTHARLAIDNPRYRYSPC